MHDLWSYFSGFTADLKGALAGGVIYAIIERRGSYLRRVFNGVGSVIISVTCTRGAVQLLNLSGEVEVIAFVALVFGFIGIIVAETIQRFVVRLSDRAETLADKAIDRVTGQKDHRHD